MNNSNKYNAVLEKLKKLVAMKWDLETVLKNKDNILNPPYSKFPLKTNSNTNMTTPKVNNLFPHLQTVNVDTTPRRKRGGMEMSPSNTFTGGPELLHQLAFYISKILKIDTKMF